MKSPAIRQPFKFLQRLEIEAKKLFVSECAVYEVKLLIAEEQKKQRKEAVAKAMREGNDPEQAAQSIVIETPKEPTRPGRNVKDPRSDICMLVGLLFFMITVQAPRKNWKANQLRQFSEKMRSYKKQPVSSWGLPH